MLQTDVVAAAVQVAVGTAVVTVVHVAAIPDDMVVTSPSPGDIVPRGDVPFGLWPFPILTVAARTLALSTRCLGEALLGGWCDCPLLEAGPFLTFAGGGIGWSFFSVGGTLAALTGAPLDRTGVAGTTADADLVAEVLGWDLDILALGEGQGGGVGKKFMFARKSFLDTLVQEDGGGMGVEEEVVVVGGVRLLSLSEGAWVGGCCEVDGC
ncbi:hypothetical protein NDU88_000454 [Pleurodeles waltl]|uniref:Secreted protein n=1 Tax=Pleurodeles waltl TaxID=8319 RepID=A0AAV7TH96_PLEWA|nr:hypothetical protein NDU88_000454 [Pleurodeles waltl]